MIYKHKSIIKRVSLVVLLLALWAPLHAQDEGDDIMSDESEGVDEHTVDNAQVLINRYQMGNGLRLVDKNGNHLTLSALVQASAQTNHYDDISGNYNRFRIRRARVRLDGTSLHARLRYRLGLDMVKGSETDADGAGSMLQDAWIAYRPWGDNRLQFSFGQRATPTDNIELSISSHALSFAERSKITSMFSTIREVGFFVESSHHVGHTKGVIRPSLAITDGDGPISGGKRYGGLKYGGRINYLPLGTFRNYGQSREGDMAYEFTPKLCLGVAYSYNMGTSDRRGGRSSGDILYLDAKDRYRLPDMSKLVADTERGVFSWLRMSTMTVTGEWWSPAHATMKRWESRALILPGFCPTVILPVSVKVPRLTMDTVLS